MVGVQDATFSVGRGQSTLIRHINRLTEPTSDAVFYEGQNVNAMNPRDLRSLRAGKIDMVFSLEVRRVSDAGVSRWMMGRAS